MKKSIIITISICVLLIILSIVIFCLPLMRPQPQTPEPDKFILKDNNGTLALFKEGESQPMRTYAGIYTHLLPETDVLALQAGIPVATEEELARLIEDYGG